MSLYNNLGKIILLSIAFIVLLTFVKPKDVFASSKNDSYEKNRFVFGTNGL